MRRYITLAVLCFLPVSSFANQFPGIDRSPSIPPKIPSKETNLAWQGDSSISYTGGEINLPVSSPTADFGDIASGGGQSAVGVNDVTVSSNGSYKSVIVTVASKFGHSGGTQNRYANTAIYINNVHYDVLQTSAYVYKGGSKGHQWSYEVGVTKYNQYSITLKPGDVVRAVVEAGNLHIESHIRIDFTA